MALMLLDLNGFKQVNDTNGHQAGDVLLQQVAKRLLGAVRDDDVVSRLGGDEFAILLTRDPDEAAATAVAERICDRMRRPFTIDGEEVHIGGSVGIALFPDDATDYDALMRGADAAMYEPKRDLRTSAAHPAGWPELTCPDHLLAGIEVDSPDVSSRSARTVPVSVGPPIGGLSR